NAGAPNGATPSSRMLSGAANPASARPRRRCRPACPDSPSSALSVITLAHACDADACTAAASGKGVPVSEGRRTPRAAQPPASAARTRWTKRRSVLDLRSRVTNLAFDGRAIDVVAVAVEGLGPGGDSITVLSFACQHVAVVVLHDGVERQ